MPATIAPESIGLAPITVLAIFALPFITPAVATLCATPLIACVRAPSEVNAASKDGFVSVWTICVRLVGIGRFWRPAVRKLIDGAALRQAFERRGPWRRPWL